MKLSPESYLRAAVIARCANEELQSRLDLLALKPKVIINAGFVADDEKLKAKYANAEIKNLNHTPFNMREDFPQSLCGVDMLITNMMIPYLNEPQKMLSSWRKMMNEEGILIFSALGPDTLQNYDRAFHPALPHLHDMHDIGDLLIQCGFSDPVLDVEYITLTYQDQKKFIEELYASAMLMQEIDFKFLPEQGPYEAKFEIIYGHAFAPAPTNTAQISSNGNAYFPLEKLKRKMQA